MPGQAQTVAIARITRFYGALAGPGSGSPAREPSLSDSRSMAQVRSRQKWRAARVGFLGPCAPAIWALAIWALAILALATPGAQAQRAAVPGAFDDWSPSGRVETPPRALPAPTPRPAPTPTQGGRLGYSTILGTWCAPSSRYKIERRQLIVFLSDGRRVVFPITSFTFNTSTVLIRWTSDGNSKRTIFGRFSANRRRMVQFGVNRTYNRC